MPQVLYTTASAPRRTITIVRSDDVSERLTLYRFASGDVCWRLDEYKTFEDPTRSPEWSASQGRVSVADVLRRVPGHAQPILDWTRNEIELGIVVADDIVVAIRRQEALERLERELDEARARRRDAA